MTARGTKKKYVISKQKERSNKEYENFYVPGTDFDFAEFDSACTSMEAGQVYDHILVPPAC